VDSEEKKLQSAKHFFLFSLILAIYYLTTQIVYPGLPIQLGSLDAPTADLMSLWKWWQAWSWLLIASLSIAILSTDYLAITDNINRSLARFPTVTVIFILSLCLSLFVRFYVVDSMYLTDDESAYLFAARSISSGQLFVDSPEQKLFYDRVFMINDGRFFPQYFYGWPLLLAVGMILKVPFLVNSLFFAGSCILIYRILCHRANPYWCMIGVALFALSPLGVINSANYLTHSSATFFTLILVYSYEHLGRSSKSNLILIAIASAAAGMLFNIRPMTGVLISLPYFVATLLVVVKREAPMKSVVALLSPGLALLLVFFLLNQLLHGSPLISGYNHYVSYAIENNFRFSWWNLTNQPLNAAEVSLFPLFDGRSFVVSTYSGWLRLVHDGLGLPVIILPAIALVWALRVHTTMASAVVLMIVGHARWYDSGVDSYGPVHLSEIMPLMGIIAILFMLFIQSWFKENMPGKVESISNVFGAIGLATVVSVFLGYSLFRFSLVATMAQNIAIPYNEVERQDINNAIIFSPVPFIDQRSIFPVSHFRYWRDNPLPDLSNNIIWVNDLGDVSNRAFLKTVPERTGYTMTWVDEGRKVEFEEIQQ